MLTRRIRVALAALTISTAACYTFTPEDYVKRNPSVQQIDVQCHPPDVSDQVTVFALQSASGRIMTDEDTMELRLFMPYADLLFVVDPNAPDPTGEAATKMYWSCWDEDRFFPLSPIPFREKPCRANVADHQIRHDPRWFAEPGKDKPPCDPSGQTKAPVTIRVCVRPPGAPSDVMRWAVVPKRTDSRWNLDKLTYDHKSAKAVVHFVFDEDAPPESAYYFNKSHPDLRCANKAAPKPLQDVLGDASMPMLGEFVSDEAKGTSPGKTNSSSTTTTKTVTKTRTKTANPSGPGTGPKLASWEQFLQDFVIAGAIANGDVSGDLKNPNGSRHGIPSGKNVGGFSFPVLQAGVGIIQVLTAVGMTPKSFVDDVVKYANLGQKAVIKEVDEKLLKMADDLIAQHGRYEMAKGLEMMGTIMPYSLAEKFTAKLGAKFQAHKIFERQAFKRFGMEGVEKAPAVILTEAEHRSISAVLNPAWIKDPQMTKVQLRELYKTAYAKHPEWLEAIESYLR